MDKLKDKVAVVTGGARGIGRGVVNALAAEGADVVVADLLPEEEAAPVVEEVERSGRRGTYIQTDVAEEDRVRSMVDTVLKSFDSIDILVNNVDLDLNPLHISVPAVEENESQRGSLLLADLKGLGFMKCSVTPEPTTTAPDICNAFGSSEL